MYNSYYIWYYIKLILLTIRPFVSSSKMVSITIVFVNRYLVKPNPNNQFYEHTLSAMLATIYHDSCGELYLLYIICQSNNNVIYYSMYQ